MSGVCGTLRDLPLPVRRGALLVRTFADKRRGIRRPRVPRRRSAEVRSLAGRIKRLGRSIRGLARGLDRVILPIETAGSGRNLIETVDGVGGLRIDATAVPAMIKTFGALLLGLEATKVVRVWVLHLLSAFISIPLVLMVILKIFSCPKIAGSTGGVVGGGASGRG